MLRVIAGHGSEFSVELASDRTRRPNWLITAVGGLKFMALTSTRKFPELSYRPGANHHATVVKPCIDDYPDPRHNPLVIWNRVAKVIGEPGRILPLNAWHRAQKEILLIVLAHSNDLETKLLDVRIRLSPTREILFWHVCCHRNDFFDRVKLSFEVDPVVVVGIRLPGLPLVLLALLAVEPSDCVHDQFARNERKSQVMV